MMLKKRSRTTINSKQGLMSDHNSPNSPSRKFISKPATCILEAKSFSPNVQHLISKAKHHHSYDVSESKNTGLGILDAIINEKTDKKSSNLDKRLMFFGSQLKVQMPSTNQNGLVESPHSVIEFGVNNKSSQLAMAPLLSPPPPPILRLSASEMEKSEDYTRVVSHGPNARTIHIFDTCIMENCGNGFNFGNFLDFCNSCRKKLGQGNDIFMYRGEVAFCSHECRNKQMLFDNRSKNSAHCESLASP